MDQKDRLAYAAAMATPRQGGVPAVLDDTDTSTMKRGTARWWSVR